MQLVIIAAGQGSRIRSVTAGIPKTLLLVQGRPLLTHLLENCTQAGIGEVVVVTGYRHEDIEAYLSRQHSELKIETVYNPEWRLENGVSVLSAQAAIGDREPFLLSMSDHWYGVDLLKKVIAGSGPNFTATVALDFNTDRIFDKDDGMKVRVDPADPTRITGMSKDLKKYDAIDCGVFHCRSAFFPALRAARKSGRCGIADTCNLLITEGTMGGVDIGDSNWLDIDTPEAYRQLTP